MNRTTLTKNRKDLENVPLEEYLRLYEEEIENLRNGYDIVALAHRIESEIKKPYPEILEDLVLKAGHTQPNEGFVVRKSTGPLYMSIGGIIGGVGFGGIMTCIFFLGYTFTAAQIIPFVILTALALCTILLGYIED